MKKQVIVFMILTFFIAVIGIDYKPQVIESEPDAYEVIKYMSNDLDNYPQDINAFYLLFDKFKLDSKNFKEVLTYFNNYEYKIMEVYPYINPLYQTMLKDIFKIDYRFRSLDDGIESIYKLYTSELEKYRLSDELDKAYINGIRIRMIKIEIHNEGLKKFINKYRDVKYSLTPYGLFTSF